MADTCLGGRLGRRERCEQEVVPAGRCDASAVATGRGQPAVRPRNPGNAHLRLGQTFEQGRVILRRRQLRQGWCVPRAANDRDALETLPLCGTNGLAHPGFALGFALRFQCSEVGLNRRVTQRSNGFQYRRKEVGAVVTVLDHVLPPALAVAEAGGLGQVTDRISVQ